jgi:hypothetical protein
MTIEEAKRYVANQITLREMRNNGKELRPWCRDAPDAAEHWGLVQQRIALNHPNPEKAACCTSLNLTTTRSKAQIAAAMAAGERLAARKASGWFGGTVQNQPAGIS